jgi:hypothetical protein
MNTANLSSGQRIRHHLRGALMEAVTSQRARIAAMTVTVAVIVITVAILLVAVPLQENERLVEMRLLAKTTEMEDGVGVTVGPLYVAHQGETETEAEVPSPGIATVIVTVIVRIEMIKIMIEMTEMMFDTTEMILVCIPQITFLMCVDKYDDKELVED